MKALLTTLLLATLTACVAAPKVAPPAPPLREQGAVLIYLQPLSQAGSRLRFRVAALSAAREDGTVVALRPMLSDIDGAAWNRAQRLADGRLPPGRYSGLEVAVSSASLKGEEGDADLLVPPEPVEIPLPFQLHRRQALVLVLRLDFEESVGAGFRFTPVFEARQALQPPVARLGLVSSPVASRVTLYDKVSGEVVGVVPTGRAPAGMALDALRRRAYVAISGEDTISAIGLLEYRVLENLRLRGGDQPTEVALTPNGATLLSANVGSRSVSVIDALSLVETGRITVGDQPRSVLVDPAGTRAYVLNTGASSVTVVDISGQRVIATIATDADPFRAQFNRNGDALYIIHRISPYLTVIDPASLAVARRVFVGSRATALRVDPATDLIYLSLRGSGKIDIYDPLSFLPVDSIETGEDVAFLAIDGESSTLHAALPERHGLQVFQLVGKNPLVHSDAGDSPYYVTLFGER